MASNDTKNKLLIAEDWKKIYQSFTNADFKSYDFDNLRRVMISYLRENYPEDFNDYIESSEYIALIDLIAFLGQNLAFRIDLNARENFLDLAERKESILRLAKLLSYNPKRNQCASGLLKIVGISSSEEIISSNNTNLQDQTIIWNDPVDSEWYEHFTRILNSALPQTSKMGFPLKSDTINGIPTKLYRFTNTKKSNIVYPFKRTINGTSSKFELTSSDIDNGSIVEEVPLPGKNLSVLYREDGYGPSGNNTGFFCLFKQGTLNDGTFNITNPYANQQVEINTPNINNTDVWLYSLDANNKEHELWTKVNAIKGNNIIYNDSSNVKNIYSVVTKADDKINLIFSDGEFSKLPQGNFKAYYRVSNNKKIIIHPASMKNVVVTIPYTSRNGTDETLTLTLSLKYTVDNASPTENNASIKRNAPATYYTQNRLITAEDYQLGADSISQDIIKTKTINRLASGISRQYDLSDPTGKYSNTLLFGDDGILYKKYTNIVERFAFTSSIDVEGILYNTIEPLFTSSDIINFYMDKFPRFSIKELNLSWSALSNDTGHIINNKNLSISTTDSNLKYVKFNTLVKFVPPPGYQFEGDNIVPYNQNSINPELYKWAKIIRVVDNGVNTDYVNGYIMVNKNIPTGSIIEELITPLPTNLTDDTLYQLTNQILSFNTVGLRYSQTEQQWKIINQNNLDTSDSYSNNNSGDISDKQLDNSWFILFKPDNNQYIVKYRALEYIFESEEQIQFFYDAEERKYNKINKNDLITVLSVNNKPDSGSALGIDYNWEIGKEYKDLSGYTNGNKVVLSLLDSDQDGIIDDPDLFNVIIKENVNPSNKIIFLKSTEIYGKTNDYNFIPKSSFDIEIIEEKTNLRNLINYPDNQLFYFIKENLFERFNKNTLKLETDSTYKAYFGRSNLNFKYVHYATSNSRIDPGTSNIMDTYILTSGYDSEFRKWLMGNIAERPLPPSGDTLYTNYGRHINNIKSISDTIIYHPVRYKVLFGQNANPNDRAVFKVVKNSSIFINDNELKSDIITHINEYFSIENWDFGEQFYFSEMATYIMQQLVPKIKSFLIVPMQENMHFGSLFEIHCRFDEIFISDATVNDIHIIDEITANNIKSNGAIKLQDKEYTNTVKSS